MDSTAAKCTAAKSIEEKLERISKNVDQLNKNFVTITQIIEQVAERLSIMAEPFATADDLIFPPDDVELKEGD